VRRVPGTTFLVALALLTGCGSGASDAQRREEAINRDEASAVAPRSADAGAAACAHAGGQWRGDTRRCSVTAALCAKTGGQWKNGKRCVVTALAGDACKGKSGMQVVEGDCVIADFSVDELAQTGMGEEK